MSATQGSPCDRWSRCAVCALSCPGSGRLGARCSGERTAVQYRKDWDGGRGSVGHRCLRVSGLKARPGVSGREGPCSGAWDFMLARVVEFGRCGHPRCKWRKSRPVPGPPRPRLQVLPSAVTCLREPRTLGAACPAAFPPSWCCSAISLAL